MPGVNDELVGDEEVVSSQLVIPRPLIHQLPDIEGSDRFKVWRWGRRRGKSRGAFIAATVGHGPGWDVGDPMFPGILAGWDVVWVGKNNPQTAQIWLEEILPRFDNVAGIDIDKVNRRVQVEDAGALHVRSAEAIGTIRGLGQRVKGIICDEAAWWPFLAGWRQELRPVLMDNEGWAIICSTTNGGPDGELNELGDKISPSGFNRTCEDVMRGAPGRTAADGWHHSHGTARDNPKIKAREFEALVNEYPPDSISLAQEVEAKLVGGGAGIAFPEWRDDVHIVRMEAPPGSVWFGSMDWGYWPRPAVFYSIASFGDRRLHYRHERLWRQTTDYRVGYELGQFLLGCPRHDRIYGDHSMFSKTRGASIAEEIQRGINDAMDPGWQEKLEEGGSLDWRVPQLVPAPAGEEQRRSRKQLLHELMRFEERTLRELAEAEGRDLDEEDLDEHQLLLLDEKVVPEYLAPRGTWHPDCTEWIASVPKLPRDPKGKEDVDTDSYDDPYDGGTYALTGRIGQNREDKRDKPPGSRDRHPGFTDGMQRRDPYTPPKPGAKQPFRTGVKWRFGERAKEQQRQDNDDLD